MTIGLLKTFNHERGFGFLTIPGAAKDAFVHISTFVRAGLQPEEGRKYSFDIVLNERGKNAGKEAAANLQVLK